MWEKLLPLLAIGFDAVIGDPRSKYHPVVLIGNLISLLERGLLRTESSSVRKYTAGFILVIVVLLIVYGSVWLIITCFQLLGTTAQVIGSALLLSFAVTPRSLAEAGREIKNFLAEGNIGEARHKVGWIVGRDTDKLTVPEVTRATVETVAENIVDGIIAPLFYFAIGGVPLAFLYRAVNTMDSMVGYKNSRYQAFGMAAARTDDVFNYIPARITGILLVISAFMLGYDAANAAKTIWRDAAKHPSPNSGIPEAGVAGALGVQLGGLNYYGGIASDRARMGDPLNELGPVHIDKTINMMYLVTVLFIAGLVLISFTVAGSMG